MRKRGALGTARSMSAEALVPCTAPFLAPWELPEELAVAAVAVDVIRAFTTAAYAFAQGAQAIYLVREVEEALSFKQRHPGALALGEERGRKPAGFDFSNSPVAISRADLRGCTLVQRTSAGTRGALAAEHAPRLWCASLVCASATVRAVQRSGFEPPLYVLTGRTRGHATRGDDDLLVARFLEALRRGGPASQEQVARELLASEEARHTLSLPREHADPRDIEYAARVDAFPFAMEAQRDEHGLRLSLVAA